MDNPIDLNSYCNCSSCQVSLKALEKKVAALATAQDVLEQQFVHLLSVVLQQLKEDLQDTQGWR